MSEGPAGAFPALGMELTHLLVVADAGRARDFYRDVVGADLYREYGGTSPAERGHEVRCFLRDPDGHLIELSEHRG